MKTASLLPADVLTVADTFADPFLEQDSTNNCKKEDLPKREKSNMYSVKYYNTVFGSVIIGVLLIMISFIVFFLFIIFLALFLLSMLRSLGQIR